MGAKVNRHGLSRTIPDDVRLAVRQACGFGCVLCGAAVVQYDHFDPEYSDAQAHDPLRIALLCGGCHDKKTRGRISSKAVASARTDPYALRQGFVRDALEMATDHPVVLIGKSRFTTRGILNVQGQEVIGVNPPEARGAPYRVNAVFSDPSGACMCRIDNNEIVIRASPWDIEIVGPTLVVKSSPGVTALSLTTIPGEGFRVDRMDMVHAGLRVRVEANGDIVMPGENRLSGVGCSGFPALAAILICDSSFWS